MADNEQQQQKQKKKVIEIPSYSDVVDIPSSGSKPYNPPPPRSSSFSSSSFTTAFSFLKSSEFYNPPPPPPSQPVAAASTSSPSSSTSPTEAVAGSSNSAQNRNAILVSHRRGNPLLKHIRNVRWVFADVVCDYLLGQSSCALYISLRYHLLHPDYLYFRIRELQKNFKLRVVLCHVDVEDVVKPLLEVTRTAMLHDCTLLCGWSLEECGRYLETIKIYENKSADSIREQMDSDYLSRLTHALTSIRHVNKTDVVTLGSTFGSLSHIMDASMEDLARCPGIGEKKVKRLYDTFHEPFRRVTKTIASLPAEDLPTEVDQGELEKTPADAPEAQVDSSRSRKESSPDVRSALSAAFAKYRDKVRKRDREGNTVGQGSGTNVASKESDKINRKTNGNVD